MASDRQVLSDMGLDFVMKVARLCFEGVFYGVYLILVYFTAIIFSKRSTFRSKGTIYILVVLTIMFAGSTTFFVMDIIDLVVRLKTMLMEYPELSMEEKATVAEEKTKHLLWTGEMLFIFMLTLGDSVVVWRTWTLYQDARLWLVVPLCTWLGSLIAAFYELGCDIHTDWAINDTTPSAASVGAESCARADTASYSLSFGTNFLCTALICYKAWQHRKFLAEHLGPSRRTTQVEKMLRLIVESGGVYLILYTLQAIPIYGGTTPASYIPWLCVNAIIQQGMGMYPTALVVLVHLQKSLWATEEDSWTPAAPPKGPQSHIRFASNHVGTTMATVSAFTPSDLSADASSAYVKVTNKPQEDPEKDCTA